MRHKNATAHNRFREQFSQRQLRIAAVEHLKTLSHRHHCQRMQIVSSVLKPVKNFPREYSASRPRSNSYQNSLRTSHVHYSMPCTEMLFEAMCLPGGTEHIERVEPGPGEVRYRPIAVISLWHQIDEPDTVPAPSVTIAISRCKSHLLRRALLDLDNVR